jgi:hypothetical protein
MVARKGGGPVIVICTGHGPLLSSRDLGGHPGNPIKSKPVAICAFTAHGAGAGPPSPPNTIRTAVYRIPHVIASEADLAPSRGLAAPPPPSHAPPTVPI